MLIVRRRVAVLVVAVWALVAATCAPGLAGGLPTAAATSQRGTTTLTAPIVQPGKGLRNASDALLVGRVRFHPPSKGRPVLIQRKVAGGSWKKVTRLREDRAGVVTFTAAPRARSGEPFTYRGVASRWHGLARAVSSRRSADVWTSTFDDEFTGEELGPQWRNRASVTSTRTCSTTGDPRAQQVAHGTLRLTVMLDPDRADDVCRTDDGDHRYYLNGQVGTPRLWSQTGGTFAARIKFARTRGQHGAFWLQPNQRQYLEGNPHDSGAEIDVVEFFGQGFRRGGLTSNVYNYGILDGDGNPRRFGGWAPRPSAMLPHGDRWWTRYHVFSVEWTDRQYTFRVDGRDTFRTTHGVSGVPEYMLLSMLSSDWELAQAKERGIEPGGTMKVDWVTAWQ